MSATTTKQKKKHYPRCDRKRCLQNAQLFPILVIPAPAWSRTPKAKIEMELGMNVCPKHAIEDVRVFMDDAGWHQLQHNFAARHLFLPQRERITVIFKALEDRKYA
jgi:hypothetical protein